MRIGSLALLVICFCYPIAVSAAGNNLAEGKPVVASWQGKKGLEAAKAVDSNEFTAWASKPDSDAEWLYVDLGKTCVVDKVRVTFSREMWAKSYEIQVSTDATSWQTVATQTHAAAPAPARKSDHAPWLSVVDRIAFAPVTARYVRWLGKVRNGEWYEFYEFEVYAQGIPFDKMDLESLATGKPLTVSMPGWATSPASNVNDCVADTFWACRAPRQWIYVDLQKTNAIGTVTFYWMAWPKRYRVQISDDAQNWKDVAYETNAVSEPVKHWECKRKHRFRFNPPLTARYVRMLGTDVALHEVAGGKVEVDKFGYFLHEFLVEEASVQR